VKLRTLSALAVAAFLCTPASSQELPPITPELRNVAAVVCIRVDEAGTVSGALIVVSSGDPARDNALLGWVRQLRWGAGPGEGWRNQWFPMPIAIGSVPPPPAPATCGPPAAPSSS
jgi:TonB family protein